MAQGILRIQSFGARRSAPVPGAVVTVWGDGFETALVTDAEGNAPDLTLPAPEPGYSLDPENTTVLPYTVCDLVAVCEGYRPVHIEGIQIFAGQVTLAGLEMIPQNEATARIAEQSVYIPPHALFTGQGGSGPEPEQALATPRVLSEVVVPSRITVHLGRPADTATNVTVSFRDYIANVASSEVYPTWAAQNKHTHAARRAMPPQRFVPRPQPHPRAVSAS